MEYIRNTLDFNITKPTVITLGKFDGLHRGHELLMEKLLEKGNIHGYATVAFTFDIPPRRQFGDSQVKVLTTNEEKHVIFEAAGVDYLIECPFTKDIMQMEPVDFIAWIVERLNVKCIVVGEDFHFGYRRAGDHQLLKKQEAHFGYETVVVQKVQEDGRDISSTFIREEIQKGNLTKANHLLGYAYFVRSQIVHGRKLGRKLGIPTINMILPEEKLLPPNGVYVSRVVIGEKWYKGVSNVGKKPTVSNENQISVETYIMDFCQNVYGQVVEVQFLDFIRPEIKFSGIEELQHQMNCDRYLAERYYKNITKSC